MDDLAMVAAQQPDDERARSFVKALYHGILGREPDEKGLNHYTRYIVSGHTMTELIAVFHDSDEYRIKRRREVLIELADEQRRISIRREDAQAGASADFFPEDYAPPGEAGRSYVQRLRSGFLDRYCRGALVLDVGFAGYDNPEGKAALPRAIGIDLDYPDYDGRTLPFSEGSVDTVFSSHCLEHILFDHAAIRDWFRVLKVGGFIVCMVPSQALYEKRRFMPSRFNEDHKRMYTPSSLARSFEEALDVNSYRVRHLAENDRGFNYMLGPETHSDGAYEIELVIEKIAPPDWTLA